MIGKTFPLFLLIIVLLLLRPLTAHSGTIEIVSGKEQPDQAAEQFKRFEGSVNPMPYLGVYLKRNERNFYDNAQVSGSFNWVKALTAGFEEPYAVSLLAGNVVSFDVSESKETKGNGYSGYLFSAGNYHIKDNMLIHDRWQEIEWKMKGDRKSPVKKLSWSFRIGAKLHDNPDITDIVYLSFRRSRLDYKPGETCLPGKQLSAYFKTEHRVLSITVSHCQRTARSALA